MLCVWSGGGRCVLTATAVGGDRDNYSNPGAQALLIAWNLASGQSVFRVSLQLAGSRAAGRPETFHVYNQRWVFLWQAHSSIWEPRTGDAPLEVYDLQTGRKVWSHWEMIDCPERQTHLCAAAHFCVEGVQDPNSALGLRQVVRFP